MERVAVALLRDLYENSHAKAEKPSGPFFPQQSDHQYHRAHTFPLDKNDRDDYMGSHYVEPVGPIRIVDVLCWKNIVKIQIGRSFSERNEPQLKETITEIYVALTDRDVASDVMRPNEQRLVVSAKGESGLHGQKVWKGGYGIVLKSIEAFMSNVPHYLSNVER